MIMIGRIYEAPAPSDGYRVLVDRLWPRGISREAAAIEHWAKAIAPSTGLRQWYDHQPERWPEFQQRYALELSAKDAADEFARLAKIAAHRDVTLLTATRSETGTHAIVLRDRLLRQAE
jgi:uncharacterized protein YeaO (DUF488 family)